MFGQISFFEGGNKFKIDKPIRLIELFAGIGSQAKALKNIGANFEHYRICEFDKYAVASYNAVHGTNFETSDITKITAQDLGIVDTDKYCYVMTYSFPCQDLSNAGLGKGMAKGSGTRSGLLWEVERLLDECKELPQVLVMENVPAVIGAKNIQHFAKWQEKLESLGYKNKWQVLNAKDYDIPQNRERCFMVSLLGDYYYELPQGKKLELRLKDMLEKEVDEKYYLDCSVLNEKLCDELISNGMVEEGDIIRHSYTRDRLENGDKNMGRTESKEKLCPTLDTRCDCLGITVKDEPKLMQVAQLTDKKYNEMKGRVYSDKGLCPTIRTMQGGGLEPKVAEPLVWDGYNQRVRADSETVGTLTQNCGADLKRNGQGIIEPQKQAFRIRKLTPKECWRLMGFADEDIDNAIAVGMSNAQLYKQAGNSIVVNVLMAIFKEIL
jgi:DNA (cytosine-5)-methyltransferase 1